MKQKKWWVGLLSALCAVTSVFALVGCDKKKPQPDTGNSIQQSENLTSDKDSADDNSDNVTSSETTSEDNSTSDEIVTSKEGIIYQKYDTYAEVIDYTGTATEVYIADTYEGAPVTSIGDNAFGKCSSLTSVYYKGTAEDWGKISIYSNNTALTNATRYYYSETQPTTTGNYWHYVDGVPTVW